MEQPRSHRGNYSAFTCGLELTGVVFCSCACIGSPVCVLGATYGRWRDGTARYF